MCRHDDGQQVNGDSGSSVRTWARKLDSSRDPLAGVRKAEEEERQRAQLRAQHEEQARIQAAEDEQARFRAEEEEYARRRAEEEHQARLRAEEEQQARRQAEEEQQARRQAQEEQQARRRAEEEQQARRQAEQEQQARRRAEQEQQARRRAEEEQLVSKLFALVSVCAKPSLLDRLCFMLLIRDIQIVSCLQVLPCVVQRVPLLRLSAVQTCAGHWQTRKETRHDC